jgi:hypothetical protein
MPAGCALGHEGPSKPLSCERCPRSRTECGSEQKRLRLVNQAFRGWFLITDLLESALRQRRASACCSAIFRSPIAKRLQPAARLERNCRFRVEKQRSGGCVADALADRPAGH